MPRQRIRTTARGTTNTEVYRKAAEEHSKDGTKTRALAKKLMLHGHYIGT